jgi:DNA-binding MarR family transcriptional regulator
MHAILFSLKRAHHRGLALSRDILRGWGITPARFDMLYAISSHGGAPQSELRHLLGVTAATVSRMAKSLEKLGFIHRTRDTVDRRRLIVTLTDLGAHIFDRAECHAVISGGVELVLTCGIALEWYASAAIDELIAFEDTLRGFRYSFSDTAYLCYPFHPDD